MTETGQPSSQPGHQSQAIRAADLRLRGRTGHLPTRVYWQSGPERGGRRPALLVVFQSGTADGPGEIAEEVCRSLCAHLDVVVLATTGPLGAEDAQSVARWAGDHAGELGADPHRLVILGIGPGTTHAFDVGLHATDNGWPVLTQLVLIRTDDSDPESPGGLGRLIGVPVQIVDPDELEQTLDRILQNGPETRPIPN